MKCEIKKCKNEASIIYYRRSVCEKHWAKYCEGQVDLKRQLNIKN
jgi:hypothetical protein